MQHEEAGGIEEMEEERRRKRKGERGREGESK
jgi:hypothetical protein